MLIAFISGLALGGIATAVFYSLRKKDTMAAAEQIRAQMKDAFSTISMEALTKTIAMAKEGLKEQSKLGEKELESKKKLIDQTLVSVKDEMKEMERVVKELEKDRVQKFGALANQLKITTQETQELRKTTTDLKSAFASTKVRGQWGERMAEDVLRLAGFIEGINYHKNRTLELSANRPDYTFLLPQDLKVNMDVKFPLNSYIKFLEAATDGDRQMCRNQFLKDVKDRIKEVTTRDYINPEEKTVDYMIVFIPNEQVYGFIHQEDHTILDEALRHKVILCSPLTLYAILAVIRQAVDNFKMEEAAGKMQALMGAFYKQWEMFQDALSSMGDKIIAAQREFDTLTTTRKRMLERPLEKIEELRLERGIEIAAVDGPTTVTLVTTKVVAKNVARQMTMGVE